jgi:crossover junction endodeoxyribonuclease RuvC
MTLQPTRRSNALINPSHNLIQPMSQAQLMFFGVDIGLTGAIAVLTENGELLAVEDMPVLHGSPHNRVTVDATALADLLLFRWHGTRAYIEFVGPRPDEGGVSGFAFGRARGVVEGVCAAAGLPVTFITPASWKRTIGLAFGSKDSARSEAARRWPQQAALFERVKDHDRAEAALIGLAGLTRRSAH